MCGIVACLALTPGERIPDVASGIGALQHRGPDGQNSWSSPAADVMLGHARLSIIDLETGTQPLTNEDRSLHAVVNGELYDFERIREELEADGHRFRTRSDSEILLHLYEDRGTSALHWLNGEFAFVLWDEKNRELFAARDRFGIKPLYYAVAGGKLYLASEAKALFSLGVPADIDGESVYQYLHVSQDPDRTFFTHVRQVPPGHFLLVRNAALRLVSYWDHDLDHSSAGADTPEQEAAAELASRLRTAVRYRLRADVPVGIYLSGGIDSAALYALATSERGGRPPEAFTVCFDDPTYNEESDAQLLADHFNGNLARVRVDQDNIADSFRTAVWHAEMPVHNGHMVARYLLSRAVRERGMKVVLSGQGSDEVLAGYAHLIADHHAIKAARGESEDVDVDRAHTTSRGLHLPVGELVDVSALQKALGFVPTWLSARAATALRLRSLAAPEFIARFAGRDPYRVFLNNFPIAKPGARMSLRQSQYLWNRSIFLHYMLAAFDDKMDMANSVEARNPYLDPAVVEYGFGLPDSLKVRGVYSKYVLRQAVRELLPPSSSGTLKKPFLAPPLGGKKAGRFTELLKDTLSGAEARDCEFIDFHAVRSMLDRLPQMSADETGLLSPVLTIALSLVLMSSFSKSDYALQPKPERFGVGANAG